MKIIVLGGTGMLGGMVLDYFSKHTDWELHATIKNWETVNKKMKNRVITWNKFNASKDVIFPEKLKEYDYIINCIGIIKPFIDEEKPGSILEAIDVNSKFPIELSGFVYPNKIIQIMSDCIFSGKSHGYNEKSSPDPTDVYGMTKSLGENALDNVKKIRCSIIGPEVNESRSLFEWFIKQQDGATLNGYINHEWNGITTLAFAKICKAIILNKNLPITKMHLTPQNYISKYALLKLFAETFNKKVEIKMSSTAKPVDRTLTTIYPKTMEQLWLEAGYKKIPSIKELLEEMRDYIETESCFFRRTF